MDLNSKRMTKSLISNFLENVEFLGLILFSLGVAHSIAITEIGVGVCFLVWIIKSFLDRKVQWVKSSIDLPVLCFTITLLISSFCGVDIKTSLIELPKFTWIMFLFYLISNPVNLKKSKILLIIFLATLAIKAVYSSINNLRLLQQGAYFPGNMTDASMFLIGIALTTSWLTEKCSATQKAILLGLLGSFIIAEILNFKRGVWLSILGVLGVQGYLKSRKLFFVGLLIFLIAFICYKPMRDRVLITSYEFIYPFGRLAMWKLVPKIVREYPLGVGYQNSTSIMHQLNPAFHEHRHFHNLYLQILVENGILGLITFLWWVVVSLRYTYFYNKYVYTMDIPKDVGFSKVLGLASFSGFIGFLLHGLTDYTFANTRLSLLIFFLIGIIIGQMRTFKMLQDTKT